MPMRALSPPELPPEVREVLKGLRVLPQKLSDSRLRERKAGQRGRNWRLEGDALHDGLGKSGVAVEDGSGGCENLDDVGIRRRGSS